MDTQVILNINKEILEKATEYAKRREISLSILIENFLQKILDDSIEKTSIVDALSGIASEENTNQDANVDFTKEHLNYLMEKYK